MSIENAKYLKEVRKQYENYPYPPRPPEEEKVRLWRSFYDSLDLLNFFCFEGKKDFSRNFRALVAGGGTGDATVYLAEQLRDVDAEIMHLDMSSSSIEAAKRRLEMRDLLHKVKFVHNSILELPKLGLGKFDYINCSGVLHHLKSPDEGLVALKDVLDDDGAIGIMVYAKYGRMPTYFMQDLMRLINKNETDDQQRVDNTKNVYYSLPTFNWVKRDEKTYEDEITHFGDAGFYDLFLHSQDKPYTVPEVYDWVENCGLKFITFMEQNGGEKLLYNPSHYIQNQELLGRIKDFSLKERQAIAELLGSNLKKHTFYVSKREKKLPSIRDGDNVPFFSSFFYQDNLYQQVANAFKYANEPVNISRPPAEIKVIPGKYTGAIFKYLDGKRSVKEIIDMVKNENPNAERGEIFKQIEEVYNAFYLFNWILLRHKSLPNLVKTHDELQQFIKKKYAA